MPPAKHMSVCHTHTNGHHHAGKDVDPSAPGVDPYVRGVGGAWGVLGLFYLLWPRTRGMNVRVCEWPVINEASLDASRHPGLLLSRMPSADVSNKRQSGIIRPPDARGGQHFNHVCVMNAAAVNHCLFIMSLKCTCNVVLMFLLLRQRCCVSLCVCVCVCNWRNWDGVSFISHRQWPHVLVGYSDNVMTRPKVVYDWSPPWDFLIPPSWVWDEKSQNLW